MSILNEIPTKLAADFSAYNHIAGTSLPNFPPRMNEQTRKKGVSTTGSESVYKIGSNRQQLLRCQRSTAVDPDKLPGPARPRVDSAVLRCPRWYEVPSSQHLIPGVNADCGLECLRSLPPRLPNCTEGVSIMSPSANTPAWCPLREAEAPATARRREGGGL